MYEAESNGNTIMGALDSVVVASLEARRRVEMASLISRQGGIPYEAACSAGSTAGKRR